jgi:23S rRNA (adenine2030-N6)-methyltransferase
MNSGVSSYDHVDHAGNAGDVWKHFILTEVAESLLLERRELVYAESHVGRPEYPLEGGWEWRGGIGRCWEHLPLLLEYSYFRILREMNPRSLRCYPGSAQLVLKAAEGRACDLKAEIWDVDPAVELAWRGWPRVQIHLGDGFSGLRSLLDRSPPGLLLIDPPYVHPGDLRLAGALFAQAERAGWIALWWQMMEDEQMIEGDGFRKESYESFHLQFSMAKMDGGRWTGARIAFAGADDSLLLRLRSRAEGLLEVLKLT